MEDFVPAGSPTGWYRQPNTSIEYFYTGKGFGTVGGEYVRRPHLAGEPDFVPGTTADVSDWVRENGVDSTLRSHRVVTTETLPGCRIVELLGIVSELTSASGWTAEAKGNWALGKAIEGLIAAAGEMGANAIVGLKVATFGAHGGLTSGFGGDAVGVLLLGTAVRVVEDAHGDVGTGDRPAVGP